MVSKVDWQTYTSELNPYWVPHSCGLVLHLSKKLSKLTLQRGSRWILQSKLTGPLDTRVMVRSYHSSEMQSVYLQPQPTGPLEYSLVWYYTSEKMQSVLFCSFGRLGHCTIIGWVFNPLQRCSRCILRLQPIGPLVYSLVVSYPSAKILSMHSTAPADWATEHSLVRYSPLSRDGVGEFYRPSQLGHSHPHWWGYPSAEMQSMYSTAPANWATRTLVGGVLPFFWDAVGVFYSPSRLGHWHTIWWGFTLYRDAVSVFYSPSWLGHGHTLWCGITPLQRCSLFMQLQQSGQLVYLSVVSYPSTEIPFVYSTAPANWATGHSLMRFYPFAEMQSIYSAAPTNWDTDILFGGVLPLQRHSRCILLP